MGNKIYQGLDNEKRIAWLRMKAQAKYRDEPFTLSWEDFKSLWTDALWTRRGVASDDLAMTRVDENQSWCISNIAIVERREHLAKSARRHRTGYRKHQGVVNE